MEIKTVGILGYGSFGALVRKLLTRFTPNIRVRVHSSRHEPDGATFFSLEETAQSDAVVFAVPIHAFEEMLQKVLPLMAKDTVIVDVATVKMHTVEILKRLAKDRKYIATHPMWGPESYEKRAGNVTGFRIVMADGNLEREDYAALTGFLQECGFDVVEMDAETHDTHLAETLFLTHFIGQVVTRAGFQRTEIDTVSFGYLMDAMESVRSDIKLFEDVYRFIPYCKEVLERFHISEEEVRKLLAAKAQRA